MSFSEDLKHWLNNNPGKGLGLAAGALFGIFFFVFGIWKLIFILSLMFVGYVIGKSFDENISVFEVLRKIFRR